MIESIFQKELMWISRINQKNVCFVIIGIFLNNNFSYGPYLCDGCYNIMQKSNNFKNIAIVHIKKSVYRIYFLYKSKREAKKLMNNTNISDKKGILYLEKLTEIKV